VLAVLVDHGKLEIAVEWRGRDGLPHPTASTVPERLAT
jgi:hypothetical protein